MIMSSAYIFGRQISPGGLPPMPDNVFFENGRFNPLYLRQGFNFSNNTYEFYRRYSAPYPEDFEYPADKLCTGTTFKFFSYGGNGGDVTGEDWTIENGCITFRHEPSAEASSNMRYLWRQILLPIANITDLIGSHGLVCVRCRCVAQELEYFSVGEKTYYADSDTTVEFADIGGWMGPDCAISTNEPFDWYTLKADVIDMVSPPDYIHIAISIDERANNPHNLVFQIDKIFTTDYEEE